MTELTLWKYQNPYANEKYDSQRTFHIGHHKILIQQNNNEKISLDRNTGNVVWDAAYILAVYLYTHHHDLIRLKRILDLSSGTGFLGISACMFGASKVIATDMDQKQLSLIHQNCDLNRVKVETCILSWGQDEIPVCMSGIDLVIASEIFYLVTSQDALIKTLKEDLGEKSLLEKLVAHGFRLEVVSRSEMQKEFELQLEYSIVKLEYKY